MRTERCAELYAIAMANYINEAWISLQPILMLFYFTQYMPGLTKSILPRIMTLEKVMKYREGGEVKNVVVNN